MAVLTAKSAPAGGLLRCHPCMLASTSAAVIRPVWLAVPAVSTLESSRKSLIKNGLGR